MLTFAEEKPNKYEHSERQFRNQLCSDDETWMI